MMKCGVGICGSCCINDDLACRDGTVFDGNHLSQKPEFGHFTISDFFSRNSYYSTVPRVLNPVNVTTFWGVTTLLRHPRVLGIIVNVLEVS